MEAAILEEGLKMLHRTYGPSTLVKQRRFRSLFGTSPYVCSRLWEMVEHLVPSSSTVKHLLWTLHFLKTYSTETTISCAVGADEKTIRKWTSIFLHAIGSLALVSNRRFHFLEFYLTNFRLIGLIVYSMSLLTNVLFQ